MTQNHSQIVNQQNEIRRLQALVSELRRESDTLRNENYRFQQERIELLRQNVTLYTLLLRAREDEEIRAAQAVGYAS